jgi:phage tail-like protein
MLSGGSEKTSLFMRKDDMMKNLYSSAIKLACGSALVLGVLILHPGSWEQRAGARAKSTDPVTGAFFQVEVEGRLSGTFSACSGIGSVTEVIEHKISEKGAKEPTIRKIPGRVQWSDVTLSRGLTSDMSLHTWRQDVIDGKVDLARKKCTITVLDRTGQPAAIWDLNNAWPSGLIINQKTAGEPLIEEMKITYESAVRRR